ncbi:hsp70-binding protein 1-like [Plakobranchus ocellatus]|uniref:Hsp70-binding protein 1-like n=1 Tax=Plakobranchus ocellatus TaxID=259542 RepID=A0AAV4CQ68_9GAST|nr:hsp70-binding protein 1-like [Plakobranchus ocellatus]
MADERNNESNGPRQPKDVKALLKFCIEATRGEDAPQDSTFESMSEERKKWLEEALTSMTVSPTERMLLCIKVIQEAEEDTEEGTELQIKSVSELQDWAEDMDIANDFIKINGLSIMPKLMSSEVSELRWRGLELLGNLSQNNPVVQDKLISSRLLPALLAMVDTDPNPLVRVKALYAISYTLSSNGTVQLLVKLLKDSEHSISHEHLMSALLQLVTDNAAARQICLSDDLGVKSFLCSRLKLIDGKEEFMEEKEYAEKLLELLNTETGQLSSSVQHGSRNNMAVLPI